MQKYEKKLVFPNPFSLMIESTHPFIHFVHSIHSVQSVAINCGNLHFYAVTAAVSSFPFLSSSFSFLQSSWICSHISIAFSLFVSIGSMEHWDESHLGAFVSVYSKIPSSIPLAMTSRILPSSMEQQISHPSHFT